MTIAHHSHARRTGAGLRSLPSRWPLAQCLLGALFVAAIAVLSLPAARADSAALGWMPLWLLGMPLASLCALAFLRRSRFRQS